jgi:SAM-dependent MidA family methyltransferase
MTGLLKSRTKDGTNPAGADDSDVEPGGSFTSHRQVAHARNASPFGPRRSVLPVTWTPWMQAWDQALYGETGFYRQAAGPAGHFATASQGIPQIGELLARALITLMDLESLDTLVDMGCGRGELLEQVHRLGPHIRCIGVDVVARPRLDEGISWIQSPGGMQLPDELDAMTDALAFANEWLDVVPCPIAQIDDDGELRDVLVIPSTGEERLGDPVSSTDRQWCQRFWPTDRLKPGDRVEVGGTRDKAWDDLVSRVASGLAVAVDYAHTIDHRPGPGTLTGFKEGRQVPPVPDGSCDLTAHVAMDSLTHDSIVDQRTVLKGLGISGETPSYDLSRRNPAEYLQSLSTASVATLLTARGGLGDFLWAFTPVR